MRPPLAALTLVLAAALGGHARSAAGAPALEPCRLPGVEHGVLCGRLMRPLDPAAPSGRQIEIHFAVLPAVSRAKRPDPVFFLAGGPGQSAIDLAGPVGAMLARFSNRRDIVLVDQRGTGRSAPLTCDDDPRPLHESIEPAAQLDAIVRCRAALQQRAHGDLRRYTTTIAMQDADAVRRHLRYGRINLVGASYGTRAALEYLRQFPDAVRRVVLDGVSPPDMVLPVSFAVDAQAAFDALLAWCASDGACAAEHPRLAQRWQELRAALPRAVTLPDPLTGRAGRVLLTPPMLAALVRAALYAPLPSSALPLAIERAADGQWAALAGLASALGGNRRAGALAQGMHFSVICAEDLPLLERAPSAGGADGDVGLTALYRQACAGWPRADVPAAFYRLQPSAVPVLLLSGAVDPVTPPRHGWRVAQALGARSRHVEVPNAGHGLLGLPCIAERVHRFVDAEDDDEALALDFGCVQGLPRPPLFRAPRVQEQP